MTQAGLAAYNHRRADRSATYSYENPTGKLPPSYERQLRDETPAACFWDAATPGYRKIAIAWVLGAKQEATRDRRMAQLVDDCAHGRLIPSQRYGDEPRWVATARATCGLT